MQDAGGSRDAFYEVIIRRFIFVDLLHQLDLLPAGLIILMMPADPVHSTFERVLAAVGQCLDRQSAEALLRLRADREMQGRIEELADKSTEGTLSPEEREEYEALIRVGNFVAILQARARRLLAEGHAA